MSIWHRLPINATTKEELWGAATNAGFVQGLQDSTLCLF